MVFLAAPLALSVACSETFEGCEASRTCPPDDPGGGDSGAGGEEPGEAGAGGEPAGGAGGSAGGSGGDSGASSGGEGGSPECSRDSDCDDDDAKNGVEACVEGSCEPGNAPPTVTSVTPDDGNGDVDVSEVVTVEFSEDIDPESVTSDSLSVSVGGYRIRGELYVSGSTATFTPAERYHLLGRHTVSVTTDVTDLDGASMLEEFRVSFDVRDGEWGDLERIPNYDIALDPKLQLDGSGNVLLAWTADPYATPALEGWHYARWYEQDEGWSEIEQLGLGQFRQPLRIAVNRAGSAIAAYVSEGKLWVRQYRDGAWEASSADVTDVSDSSPVYLAALSETGEAHVILARELGVQGPLRAFRTDAGGTWQDPETIDASALPDDLPAFAFDASGNGMLVWGASSRVHYASYDASAGEWGELETIASSIASGSSAYYHAAIAMSPGGSAAVVWLRVDSDTQVISASEFVPGDGFGEATPISDDAPTFVAGVPRVGYGGTGFVAAWIVEDTTILDGGDVHFARFQDGAWSPPERRNALGSPVDRLGTVEIAADFNGNVLLVWSSVRDMDGFARPTYSRYTAASERWSSPTQLFSLLEYGDDPSPSVAFSPNGVGAIAFRYRVDNENRSFESQVALFE